ncbi:hypothetical protein RSOL_480050 [Rhizoctonia solani AG-3 Rhs1AP]|uniref:Uncharacterized protein n=1 Tax=Rhizoctonia solani AG-3 Rhs1AP TaxID=1086054 RepID=X8JHF0_9AGAM|nr:hypothetical protein RSOL_480050 [Rhizoctonia solani AG-3 Rhs1AP]
MSVRFQRATPSSSPSTMARNCTIFLTNISPT